MLASVDEKLMRFTFLSQRPQYRGCFNEVRPRANDVKNQHADLAQTKGGCIGFVMMTNVLSGLSRDESGIALRQWNNLHTGIQCAFQCICQGCGKSRGQKIDVELQILR